MTISLALVEKKLGGIPQAEEPSKWTGEIGAAKTKPIDPKAPKAKSMGKNAEGTSAPKFAKKASPLQTGKVKTTKPESAPKSSSMGKAPTGTEMKRTSSPERAKNVPAKPALPDATSVKSRGITDKDAGEATLVVKNSVAKAAGNAPAAKRIEVGKAKIIAPEFGFGLLKAGQVMDPLGNLDTEMRPVKKSKVAEGRVINARVSVMVAGRERAVFEAATPEVIARAAMDFAEIGARVMVESTVRGRKIYEDRGYTGALLESVHASHHGLGDRAAESARAAARIAAGLLSEERDARVHQTEAQWVRDCINPLVRQGLVEVRAAYEASLTEHEVIVHGKSGARRTFKVTAADERHAAVKGIDMMVAESASDEPIRAFVGARRFLPESATFMKWPEKFGELQVPKHPSKPGASAEVRAPKVGTVSVGKSSTPGVKKLTADRSAKMVDRSKMKAKIKESREVIREVIREQAAEKVLRVLRAFAGQTTGKDKEAADQLVEMVESGAPLTAKQSEALDAAIRIALGKK